MRKSGHYMWGTALCVAVLAPMLSATDIWVSGEGDDANLGTYGSPFRTITWAMNVANANDVIKVLSGDYDVGTGEVFPIQVKAGVDILGQQQDEEDYPRVGGDVADSNVRALIEVLATADDRLATTISYLRFVGKNTSGEDAPSAVYVENANEYQAEVDIENCIIERSRMNVSGASGRASIVEMAGAVVIVEEADESEFGLDLAIFRCTIHPTDAGAVNIDVSADATNPDRALVSLLVDRCQISLSGADTSYRAIDCYFDAFDDGSETGRIVELWSYIAGNTIDASGCTGDGIAEGIVIGGKAKYGGYFSTPKNNTRIISNNVIGMKDAGLYLYLYSDGMNDSAAEFRSWHVDRNRFINGSGAGVLYEQGEGSANVYTSLRYFNTLVAENTGGGFVFRNVDDVENETSIISCTMANNSRYAIEMIDSSQPSVLARLENSIVWGNALGPPVGWDPSTDATSFAYNDYQGLFGMNPSCSPDGNNNVDIDPYFVDPNSGDFHLHASSCVIAKGDNTPTYPLPYFDMDGEDRFYARVDIGADEYHPPE